MKGRFIAFFLMIFGLVNTQLSAQDQAAANAECKDDSKVKEDVSVYTEYYKAKNYKDAYVSWKKVLEACPSATKNLYIHGPKILDFKIKNAKTEEEKQGFYQELLNVYDQRLISFPGRTGYVLGSKGSTMVKYKIGTSKEAYDVLHKAFELDGSKLSASTLYAYFTSATRLFNEKVFGDEDVFRVYEEVMETIDVAKLDDIEVIAKFDQMIEDGKKLSKKEARTHKNAQRSLKAFETVGANVEKIISAIATCDRLESLYASKFDAQSGDIEWVNGAVKMMSRKKCFDSKTFYNLVSVKSKLDPSASSSRVAGLLSLSNKDYKTALNFYKEAIELGNDNAKKADDYFKAAQALFKLGRKPESRSYCYNAIKLKPNFGEAYILIGDMYASSANECGSNAFEKKAVYWAAIDKYKKARQMDPKVSKKASQKVSDWSKQVPDKTMIFSFGYLGKPKYSIKCWIGETVNVPQD
jgi:tetratricopeptide (TPR) repeat protein